MEWTILKLLPLKQGQLRIAFPRESSAGKRSINFSVTNRERDVKLHANGIQATDFQFYGLKIFMCSFA